ncbi:unnamed protein product, partial [Discosporangium mesarthrocarpum]
VRLWDVRRSGASACLISLDRHREGSERGGGGGGGGGGVPSHDVPGGGGVEGGGAGRGGYLRKHKSAPHVSPVSSFARAHAGPVNSLCFTPDGLHLLTSGVDDRWRL